MDPHEMKTVMEQLGDGFEKFKSDHAAALDAERKRVDEIEKVIGRSRFTGGGTLSADATAERKALAKLVRTGDAGEFKTYSVGDDPSGGYLVAPVLSDTINRRVFDVSPLGRLARRVTIAEGDAFEEPIDDGDIGATWVGENSARPATTTSDLRTLRVPVREVYALQTVTQRLLDDARFDVGAWVENKIADKFARTEGTAFVTGDGVNRPRGLLTYPTTTEVDGVRAWFTIQHVNTGANGAFIAATTSASPADCLVDLVYALRAPYRPNARFLMNRRTAGVVRKLKDSEGKFIWADAREGQPATLLGFPVELDEEMPDITTGSLSIAFGDMAQAYLVVEKPGARFLRDPFTSKPNVLMYAYRRIGGSLQNGEAVKLLRFSA